MRDISLIHLTAGACPPDELVRLASEAGYDRISFRGIGPRGGNWSNAKSGNPAFVLADDPDLLRRTRAALAETGLKLNDIENARIFDGADIRAYERDLAAARELGCDIILTNIWSKDRSKVVDDYGLLCDMAAQYGQTMNIEFVTWSEVKTIRDSLEIIRQSGRENVGVVVDAMHMYRSGVPAEDLDLVPKEWLRFMHICDAPEEIPGTLEELARTGVTGRLNPGDGAIPLRLYLERMPRETVVSIEAPDLILEQKMGTAAYLKYVLEATRTCLKNIGMDQ